MAARNGTARNGPTRKPQPQWKAEMRQNMEEPQQTFFPKGQKATQEEPQKTFFPKGQKATQEEPKWQQPKSSRTTKQQSRVPANKLRKFQTQETTQSFREFPGEMQTIEDIQAYLDAQKARGFQEVKRVMNSRFQSNEVPVGENFFETQSIGSNEPRPRRPINYERRFFFKLLQMLQLVSNPEKVNFNNVPDLCSIVFEQLPSLTATALTEFGEFVSQNMERYRAVKRTSCNHGNACYCKCLCDFHHEEDEPVLSALEANFQGASFPELILAYVQALIKDPAFCLTQPDASIAHAGAEDDDDDNGSDDNVDEDTDEAEFQALEARNKALEARIAELERDLAEQRTENGVYLSIMEQILGGVKISALLPAMSSTGDQDPPAPAPATVPTTTTTETTTKPPVDWAADTEGTPFA